MTTPTRSDYPRCRTCGHYKDGVHPRLVQHFCKRHNWVFPPDHGCIDHTDLDAPDDPRQVTGTAHGYMTTEDTDGGPAPALHLPTQPPNLHDTDGDD